MNTVGTFIRRHAVLSYFVLTFAISWGGLLILATPYGVPARSADFEQHWPVVFLPYLLGPAIAGLVMIGLVGGRAGYRELLARMLRWRVGLQWYALAILAVPLLVTGVLLALSLADAAYLPAIFTAEDKGGLLLMGLAIGFFGGGLLEETGWTGFALPELRRTRGVLSAGLILGALWGLWHILPTYWGSGDSAGNFDLMLFLPPCLFYVGVLPAYRMLMVWAFERSGSHLIVMLMHTGLTASTLFILAPALSGMALIVYYLILSALLWALVGVAVAAHQQGGTQRSLRQDAA